MAEMPVINREKCNGCGLCVNVCSLNSIAIANNMALIMETEECDWCTYCEAVCPTGAIACPYEVVIEEH